MFLKAWPTQAELWPTLSVLEDPPTRQPIIYSNALLSMSSAARHRNRGVSSIARVYANANVDQPKEYWDYEAFQTIWR